jgi:hypothetical protein
LLWCISGYFVTVAFGYSYCCCCCAGELLHYVNYVLAKQYFVAVGGWWVGQSPTNPQPSATLLLQLITLAFASLRAALLVFLLTTNKNNGCCAGILSFVAAALF